MQTALANVRAKTKYADTSLLTKNKFATENAGGSE